MCIKDTRYRWLMMLVLYGVVFATGFGLGFLSRFFIKGDKVVLHSCLTGDRSTEVYMSELKDATVTSIYTYESTRGVLDTCWCVRFYKGHERV